MVNLDYIAAKYAGTVPVKTSGIENSATSALNILHEQGIYAMCLWLLEKSEQNGKRDILSGMDKLFHDSALPFSLQPQQRLTQPEVVRDLLTMNLKTMFFAKNLIELYLIYIRHLAKAVEKEG